MSIFRTYTGKRLNLENKLNGMDLDIEDIAHSLSLQCRFNGMTDRFYSVAEHSVRCAILYGHGVTEVCNGIKPLSCRAVLMHDASEAYITDIPTPLKKILGEPYYRLEAEIMTTIADRFGFRRQWEDPLVQEAIKKVDQSLLCSELKTMFKLPTGDYWYEPIRSAELLEGIGWGIGWPPNTAKRAYLSYYYLTKDLENDPQSIEW